MTERLRQFPVVDAPHGVTRQVLSENKDLMVVSFTFPEGGKGELHDHPQRIEQQRALEAEPESDRDQSVDHQQKSGEP